MNAQRRKRLGKVIEAMNQALEALESLNEEDWRTFRSPCRSPPGVKRCRSARTIWRALWIR